MLAAHVMPNHPAVAPLLSEVADRLGASTGSPSVQGYQAGRRLTAGIRERLVQALVLALSDGRLRRDRDVLVAAR